MKRMLTVFVVLCITAANAGATMPLGTESAMDIDAIQAAKDANMLHNPYTPGAPAGGEDVGTATVIPGLPYVDVGNTCAAVNDYVEACPFINDGAGDLVYAYTPGANGAITIGTCNSFYDTRVYVYENAVTPGFPYACNDDGCSGPNFPFAWLSFIENMPVTAGNTYYIVVDGYSTECGDYELTVDEYVPPAPCEPCPANAIIEGEPDCADGYADDYNAGCNFPAGSSESWTALPCGDRIDVCGKTGNGYITDGFFNRDTDWYRITLTVAQDLHICFCADFAGAVGVLDAICPPIGTYCFENNVAGTEICCDVSLGPGDYYIFASTAGFGDLGDLVPCGSEYTLSITGHDCPTTATEDASWGEVKSMFR